MKSITFTEEQLGDMDALKAALFADPNDPTSTAYVRKLNRPKIHWWKLALYCLALVLAVTGAVLAAASLPLGAVIGIGFATGILYLGLTLKWVVVCIVKLYQRFAPASIRNKCRFEPSCSEYMLLSIEKYGILQGLRKGIGRLKRCNINHGGFDFP